MKTTEFCSELLRERYVRILHPSGLRVYVFPKQLSGTYALLATDFGAQDLYYREDGEDRIQSLPAGIAHFLEHKLFENEDGSDALAAFSALGVDANAYTACNKTAYLFSCTENFDAALEELLRFVMHPHFTAASVKREIGIISEEIRMTEDNPWDRGYQNLLGALYHKHPVRFDICGTQESIRKITPELLYSTHRSFYDLSHLSLVVCGDVTEDAVMETVNRCLPKEDYRSSVRRVMPDEPKTVCKERVEARMQVAKPIFFMGYKDNDFYGTPSERMRRDAAVTLLNEILFSRSGDFYNELFEKGILAPSFTCGYSICETLAFNCLSGETDTPDEVIARVQAYLDLVKREGIREEDIERCRRVLYADEVRSYDSTEEIANRLLSFAIDGGEMLAYPEMIAQITKEELVSLAETLFDRANLSVSVIYPLEQR